MLLLLLLLLGNAGVIALSCSALLHSCDYAKQTQNGALHVVDTVLIPNSIRTAFNAWRETLNSEAPQTNKSTPTFVPSPISSNTSLAEWVRSTPTLSTLWGAIYFADLIKLLLEGPGPFTLLAPNDEVSARLR